MQPKIGPYVVSKNKISIFNGFFEKYRSITQCLVKITFGIAVVYQRRSHSVMVYRLKGLSLIQLSSLLTKKLKGCICVVANYRQTPHFAMPLLANKF